MDVLLAELKQKDYDKYLACLFADKDLQPKLAAVFLFHHEIYDIPQNVSEPMVGKIKIQWWRDVLQEILENKPARPHPILQELKENTKVFDDLFLILDAYEKTLDGFQPKNFKELTEFVESSICNAFKAACKISNSEYNKNLALAYSFQFIARKIILNKSFAEKLKLIPQKLIDEAEKNLNNSDSVFQIISAHYIKLFKANNFEPSQKKLKSAEWKLALKLFFSNPKFL